MIQLKINGQNKRTIIDSLRYEILKQKQKLYLMRFKSLPFNKRLSRNKIRLDLPQTVKAKNQNQLRQYFNNLQSNHQKLHQLFTINNRPLQEKQSVRDLLKKQRSHNRFKLNTLNDQIVLQKVNPKQTKNRRINTLSNGQQNQQSENHMESSLQDYIKRHLSLKQTIQKNSIEQINKITIQNNQKINSIKKPIYLKSNLNDHNFTKNISSMSKQLSQNNKSLSLSQNNKSLSPLNRNNSPLNRNLSPKSLFQRQLSPQICRIHKLQMPKNQQKNQQKNEQIQQQLDYNSRNILSRTKIYKNLQSTNTFQQQYNKNIYQSQKKYQYKNTKGFKNSIGPWRNSGFGSFKK